MFLSDVTPVTTTGTKIATIGSKELYAPSGSGGLQILDAHCSVATMTAAWPNVVLDVDSTYYMPVKETTTGYVFSHLDEDVISWTEFLKDGTGCQGGSVTAIWGPATTSALGAVKIGSGLSISNDGIESVTTAVQNQARVVTTSGGSVWSGTMTMSATFAEVVAWYNAHIPVMLYYAEADWWFTLSEYQSSATKLVFTRIHMMSFPSVQFFAWTSPSSYSLWSNDLTYASASEGGVVKIGTGLSIDSSGVLSVDATYIQSLISS